MNDENNSQFQRGGIETAQPEITAGVSPKPVLNVAQQDSSNTNLNSKSETPSSSPKKKGNGSLIAAIVFLLVVVIFVLVFVFDIFGLKKNTAEPKKENEKTSENAGNQNNGGGENNPISNVTPEDKKTLTQEEEFARNNVIRDYLIPYINKNLSDNEVEKAGVKFANCTDGKDYQTCEASFNFSLEKYDLKKCDSIYKKYDFISVESCEDGYISAKHTVNITQIDGTFSVVNE